MDEDRQNEKKRLLNEFFSALEKQRKEQQKWQYNFYARMRGALEDDDELLEDLARLLLEHSGT